VLDPRNNIQDLEDNFVKVDNFYFGISIQPKLAAKITRHIRTCLCGAQMFRNNYIFIWLREIKLLFGLV